MLGRNGPPPFFLPGIHCVDQDNLEFVVSGYLCLWRAGCSWAREMTQQPVLRNWVQSQCSTPWKREPNSTTALGPSHVYTHMAYARVYTYKEKQTKIWGLQTCVIISSTGLGLFFFLINISNWQGIFQTLELIENLKIQTLKSTWLFLFNSRNLGRWKTVSMSSEV